jgi:hypothetical protein
MSQENTTSKQPLIRYVNRQQMSWRAVDVEKLIGEDHPARAIWALATGLKPTDRLQRAVVVDAEKKESERKRKRKTLSGEKKEVCSKRA